MARLHQRFQREVAELAQPLYADEGILLLRQEPEALAAVVLVCDPGGRPPVVVRARYEHLPFTVRFSVLGRQERRLPLQSGSAVMRLAGMCVWLQANLWELPCLATCDAALGEADAAEAARALQASSAPICRIALERLQAPRPALAGKCPAPGICRLCQHAPGGRRGMCADCFDVLSELTATSRLELAGQMR